MNKICISCKVDKPYSEYHLNKKNANGIQSVCKICRKELDKVRFQTSNKREKTKERIKKLLNEINDFKSNFGCVICGELDFRCLDLHHKNPKQKIMSVSEMVHRGLAMKQILEEIAKCIVLCANCHRKLHN